jgi:hypothetical protein
MATSTRPSTIAALRPAVGTHDLTSSLTLAVDAARASVDTALRRLDLVAPLTRAVRALDATGRMALAQESCHRPGYIRVGWEIDMSPSERGALLSIVSRFSATDDRPWRRLLQAWEPLGVIADAVVRHAARTVKTYAENLEEE